VVNCRGLSAPSTKGCATRSKLTSRCALNRLEPIPCVTRGIVARRLWRAIDLEKLKSEAGCFHISLIGQLLNRHVAGWRRRLRVESPPLMLGWDLRSMDTRFKWPKNVPPLDAEQLRISNDFMRHSHEVLPKRYGALEQFNHGYPLRILPDGSS
jgi:hypothetical protein